jgi:hypothetical protein
MRREFSVSVLAAAMLAWSVAASAQPGAPAAAEPPLTLERALAQARTNSQMLVAAQTAARIAT